MSEYTRGATHSAFVVIFFTSAFMAIVIGLKFLNDPRDRYFQVSGYIVDSASGEPVSGATVVLTKGSAKQLGLGMAGRIGCSVSPAYIVPEYNLLGGGKFSANLIYPSKDSLINVIVFAPGYHLYEISQVLSPVENMKVEMQPVDE